MLDKTLERSIHLIHSINSTPDEIKLGIKLKKAFHPDEIYKFRRLNDNAVENVINNNIWFDSPSNMNDPYDCKFTYSSSFEKNSISEEQYRIFLKLYDLNQNDELLDKVKTGKVSYVDLLSLCGKTSANKIINSLDDLHKNNMKIFIDMHLKNTFFCSFSSIYNSLLMWAHYTENHTGFCIQYDLSKTNSDDIFIRGLFPILYTHELFNIDELMLNRDLINDLKFNPLYLFYPLIHKSNIWSYESEWRIIIRDPLVNAPRNISTPPISKIILGSDFFKSNLKNPTRRKLAEKLILHCKMENINLSTMEHSSTSYEMYEVSLDHKDALEHLNF